MKNPNEPTRNRTREFLRFYCKVGTESVISFSYNSYFKGLNSLEIHIIRW